MTGISKKTKTSEANASEVLFTYYFLLDYEYRQLVPSLLSSMVRALFQTLGNRKHVRFCDIFTEIVDLESHAI
jgi:hypothetical protein